ncbi:hypothetical protein PG984_009769 [Apiospora sp. TS-2023a]
MVVLVRSRLAGFFGLGGVVHLGLRLIVDFLSLGGFIIVGSGFGDWGFIMCCGSAPHHRAQAPPAASTRHQQLVWWLQAQLPWGIPPPLLLALKQQQWLVQASQTRSSPQAFRLSASPLADLALLVVREMQKQLRLETKTLQSEGTERRSSGAAALRARVLLGSGLAGPAPFTALFRRVLSRLRLADPLLAVLDIPPRLFLDGVHLELGLVLGGVHVAVELLLALLVLPGPARLELLVFLAPAPFALFVFDPPRLDDAVALRLSLPVELGPLPFVRRAQVREQRVPLLLQLIEAGVVLLDRQKRGDGLVDLRQVVVHLLH